MVGAIGDLARQLGIEAGENGEKIRINSVHAGPSLVQTKSLVISFDQQAYFEADAASAVVSFLSDQVSRPKCRLLRCQ